MRTRVWTAALLALAMVAGAQETPPPAVEEEQLTGTVDFGYRWVLGKGGSQDVYRSFVNLGEGLKLFAVEAGLRNSSGKLYDRIDVRASSWGGDPYNTARVEVARTGAYNFRLDYRNVAYFNSIPSFANPLLGDGVLFSQRSFDTTRRLVEAEVDLLPGARFSPYLAYYHGSGFGRGVTSFVTDGDEFPVSTRLRDSTDSYRGGLRLNLARLNMILEQGGTTFKDDQEVGFAGLNPGNRRLPLFGQDILLRDLRQAYGARGSGVFNRAVIEARPFARLTFTGHFLYSKPAIDVNYMQQNAGNFLLLNTLTVFTGQLDRSIGEANRPRSSGSLATEFRPIRRLRILQSWLTDRFHIAAGSFLARTLATAGGPVALEAAASDRLVLNYNRHQVDAILEVASSLTLRVGHRYEWGDAVGRAPTLAVAGPPRAGLARHVALAGATLRLRPSIDLNLDLEAAAGDRTFFRTDLADYQRGKVRGRYRLTKSMALTGSFAILNNRNATPSVNLDYQGRQSALALLFAPNDGKRWSLLVDYTRATVRSSLPYLAPQDRIREVSRYRDDGHHGGAGGELNFWRGARLQAGGSFSVTAGSRPSRYYQPYGRASVPLDRRLSFTSEWRWFGFDQRRFGFENFHTHLFSTGLRIGL